MSDDRMPSPSLPVAEKVEPQAAPAEPASAPARARYRPRLWLYLGGVLVMYASALIYAVAHELSVSSLYRYGLLQPPGLGGESARLVEIETPLSWNLPQVVWFVYLKGSAVLVELFGYWVIGMLIAGALIVLVSWEKVKARMGHGGLKASAIAAAAGAVIPICSCGVVPVLAGMVQAGVPLGPTMAFLIAAPMLNIPTVFMTAGVLGWPMAVARILATFAIALTVGGVLSRWQRRHRSPRQFLRIHIPPRLTPEMQQFAFRFGALAASHPEGIEAAALGAAAEHKLSVLEEGGLAERTPAGLWKLAAAGGDTGPIRSQGACSILPSDDGLALPPSGKLKEVGRVALDLFMQLNGYLLLAVWIAGAIKVLAPTELITAWVGGVALQSVLLASVVALLAYVCTYVEVPTALALMSRGMGPGATLAYLLGGPGLSLPSLAMLSGVFRARVLVLYAGVSFLGCVLAGSIYNLFMG